MAPKPEGVDEGIVRGIYRFAGPPDGVAGTGGRVRLVGSGAILPQVVAAQRLLAERFDVAAEVYSAPSFQQLRREAIEADRWNRLHPDAEPRVPYVRQVLGSDGGPIVIATDWMKAIPDLVRPWLPDATITLGTDGYGRSDTREALRALFEIDGPSIAAAALSGLARTGAMPAKKAATGIRDLGIDPDRIDPLAL
jgi:pyruvate dehydrogenase E1 component